MRKTKREKTKLVIKQQTIRALQAPDLAEVIGGGSASGGTWSAGTSWFQPCGGGGTCNG